MTVIYALSPVTAIIILGYILKRTAFLPEEFFTKVNRLVFYVSLPCLLFLATAKKSLNTGDAFKGVLVIFLGMIASIVLGFLLVYVLKIPRKSVGAFVQGAFRGNLAFVGWPVAMSAILASNNGLMPEALETYGLLVFVPIVPIYNIAAVLVLLISAGDTDGADRPSLESSLLKVATNPLIISTVLGIGFSFTGWNIPAFLDLTFEKTGQMAFPLALISIGSVFTFDALKGSKLRWAIASTSIKSFAAPFSGFLVGKYLLGLTGAYLLIPLIYLACPTAIMGYIMATQMDNDGELAGMISVMALITSFISLTIILFFF